MLDGILDNNQAFYALLRGGLWEKEVHLATFNRIDYSKIYRLAEEQSILGLIAAGIEHVKDVKIPQEEKLNFVGTALQLEQKNAAINHFIESLINKLRNVEIYALLLKGQGIAQYYERPLWRACGDVDLFLSDSNYEKAKNLLMPLASSIDVEGKYNKHLEMTIDSWVVELHGSLNSGLSTRVDRVLAEIKDSVFYGGNVRSWLNGETQVFLPSADVDAIYVFTHFLEHFYKEGVGLRQICDWCRLLWTYRFKLDLRLLETRIRRMGLMSEWHAFGAFAVDYLGMPVEAMPLYSPDTKWKRKADKISAFILEVGNMGHNRDMSYFEKYPYLIRKVCSMGRRCSDLVRHARIFPLDSLRFFPRIMFNGFVSAVRGE
jgi:hypothetical protein